MGSGMSRDGKTLIIGSCIFFAIACILLPFTILCGKTNGGLARIMIIMSAFCCWLFWILVFMSQMNPLIKPEKIESEAGCTIQ
ncbi:V-type H+-transporting ATPase subunit e [Acrasis kona]|uniref:V-type H+-transporting ATPase subunit e n=1 Tax=Acrasis kona TaxID=1008807 RepID=A0AAW2Z6L0_9EUKA